MGSRKNMIKKAKAKHRKTVRTPGQRAKDGKEWACVRKVQYVSKDDAQSVADRLGHKVYECSYCKMFHTAHLPGSRRFAGGVAA